MTQSQDFKAAIEAIREKAKTDFRSQQRVAKAYQADLKNTGSTYAAYDFCYGASWENARMRALLDPVLLALEKQDEALEFYGVLNILEPEFGNTARQARAEVLAILKLGDE